MDTTYEITTEEKDLVIRLPKSNTDQQALSKFLDYLELEATQRRSQLDRHVAEELTTEIKKGAWQQVAHLFKEP